MAYNGELILYTIVVAIWSKHIGMEINDIAIDDLVGWETLARLRSS